MAKDVTRCLIVLILNYLCKMSRGRGGRGGRGGARGGFGGAAALPPMGLSFADIQNLSRDPTQLYPVRISLLINILLTRMQ